MSFAYQADKFYLELFPHVLVVEGGYVNDPKDRGGPTKWGVAWNFHGDYLRSKFGINDVRELTKEQALEFYFDKFWIAPGCNLIPDKRFAYLNFDAAVNHGVGDAAKLYFRVARDGKNPKHYAGGDGANEYLWLKFCWEHILERLRYYGEMKQFPRYGRGWTTNRIPEVMQAILEMMGEK